MSTDDQAHDQGEDSLALASHPQPDAATEDADSGEGFYRLVDSAEGEATAGVDDDLPQLKHLPELDTPPAQPRPPRRADGQAAPGTPLPYQHADLAEEIDQDGPPVWLGQRWREMSNEDKQHAWVGLRRWVDWLIEEHHLSEAIVPACWFRHSEIVAELYAAMNMEFKVFEEATPSPQPLMMWLPNFEQMKHRLRGLVEETGSCGKGTHTEPERMRRTYDEQLWRATVYTHTETQSFARPTGDADHRLIRARAVASTGEELGTSGIKALKPRIGAETPELILDMEKTTGVNESTLTMIVEGNDDEPEIIWEDAEHPEGPWRHINITEQDSTEP